MFNLNIIKPSTSSYRYSLDNKKEIIITLIKTWTIDLNIESITHIIKTIINCYEQNNAYLDLSGIGITTFIPAEILKKLSHVKNLNLSDNKIAILNLEDKRLLSNLESLDLSFNNIEIIPDKLFEQCSFNLKQLSFKENNISSITTNVLYGLNNLEVLDISGNPIENFDINIISSLKKLIIFDISN